MEHGKQKKKEWRRDNQRKIILRKTGDDKNERSGEGRQNSNKKKDTEKIKE